MMQPLVKNGKLIIRINNKLYPAVVPHKAEGNSYFILCPYCGEEHTHGRKPGLRYSHCETPFNELDSYYILEVN